MPVVGGGETSTWDAVGVLLLLLAPVKYLQICTCFSSRSCEAFATVLVVLYLDMKIGVEGCFFELLRCVVSQTTAFVCLFFL